MRILAWAVLGLLLPGRVMAAPEPPPPGDYPGAQYIDRTGCVFVREGEDWLPRLDKAGAPICGFPPSQPAEAAAPETPPSPEEVLTAVLAENLRPGDLVSDKPAAPLAPVAPDPAQAQLDAALAGQLALDARIRAALAGPAPDGLCARLGYRPAGDAPPIVGGDVTQGLCPGMAAVDPAPVFSGATATTPEAGPVSGERPDPARRQAKAPVAARDKPAPARSASVIARRPAPPPKPAAVEMIPASARYVQIGAYADEANALAALRRLSGMGYRTAQRRDGTGDAPRRAILAGPFADRQALVAALTRLRANGYPRAVAR